ncbi:hypothetical protein ACLBWX_03410 [Methylobacterium sp. M6A4_1b]
MTPSLTPVALAGAFVVGCVAIRALQRWADLVLFGLAWIFAAVVLLLLAEIAVNHQPPSAGHTGTGPIPSGTAAAPVAPAERTALEFGD